MNQAEYESVRGPAEQVLWFGEVELDRLRLRLPAKILQVPGERPYLVILEQGARIRMVRTCMPAQWFHPPIPEGLYRRLAWQEAQGDSQR